MSSALAEIEAREPARKLDESNVDIAVIDTGVDTDHGLLRDSLAWGVDLTGNRTQVGLQHVEDVHGHGTNVAALATGQTYRHTTGVAPEADLYVFRVAKSGSYPTSNVVEAIERAVRGPDGIEGTDDDADVISMSIVFNSVSPSLKSTIRRYMNHTVFVAAAGNSGDRNLTTDEVQYPARLPSVIAVGAAGNGRWDTATFSSEGSAVDVTAPGQRVQTAGLNGSYIYMGGTSMATPLVAGTAALIVAARGEVSTTEARRYLNGTAVDTGPPGIDNATGAGLIHAARATGIDNSASVPEGGISLTGEVMTEQSPGNATLVDLTLLANATLPTATFRVSVQLPSGSQVDTVYTSPHVTVDRAPGAGQTGLVELDGRNTPGRWVVRLVLNRTRPQGCLGEIDVRVTPVTDGRAVDGHWTANWSSSPVGQPATGVSRFDSDGDGSIDAREVLAVVAAYNDGGWLACGPVTTQQLLDSIAAYNSGNRH